MLTSNTSQMFMRRTSLDIAGNSSGIITFTRQSDLGLVQRFNKTAGPWASLKVQKGHKVKNIPVKVTT